jgi:hypothetical protein
MLDDDVLAFDVYTKGVERGDDATAISGERE